MSRTRMNNDPELDDFLRRTHKIDNERKLNKNNGPPPVKPKPKSVVSNQLNQFNEKDLNEARRILQDSDMIEFNEEMVIDGTEYNENDLSYKSAYNYEKTFSPKKKKYSLEELDLERDANEPIYVNSRNESRNSEAMKDNATFSVSKEDYLLLQRLKKGNNLETPPQESKITQPSKGVEGKVDDSLEVAEHEISPRKQTMPSRGKPRSANVKIKYNLDIDMNSPSLPPRRTQQRNSLEEDDGDTMFTRRFNKVNVYREEESSPPKLPTRPTEAAILMDSSTSVDLESEDESDKPALPTRFQNRTSLEQLKKTIVSARDVKAKKDIPNINRSTKYNAVEDAKSGNTPILLTNLAPEPITMIDLISDEETEEDKLPSNEKQIPPREDTVPKDNLLDNKSTELDSSTNRTAPPPPTSRKQNEPVSFLTSLDKNKLTEIHSSAPETPKKKAALHGMDYLDSVQLKSPTPQASPNNSKISSPVKPKILNIPRSESFIDSALNSKLDIEKKLNTPPLVKGKPKLPVKPTKLSNENSTEIPAQLRLFRITKAEKQEDSVNKSPAVPPKSKLINFGALKPVTTTQSIDNKKDQLQKDTKIDMPKLRSVNGRNGDKKQAPVVPKRKPTIPEALINGQNLKKTNVNLQENKGIFNGKTSEPQPEALLKIQNLAKSKVKPAVPARKGSLPEALKRANQLKIQRSSVQSNTSVEISSATDLPTETINDRLESMIALRQRKTFSGSNSAGIPTPIRRSQTTVSSNNTSGSSTPLVHVTRGRAKGPKRKLPSKI